MAKEEPRYRAIKEYELEFKKEYGKTIGEGFKKVVETIKGFMDDEKRRGKKL